MRFFFVTALLSVAIYVAVIHVKDWDKGGKEEKGRLGKFISIFTPSYQAQKKLLIGIVIVMVLIGGVSALDYFQDNNKWKRFEKLLERDRTVKSEYVYGNNPGVDLSSYDKNENKLFPDLYNEEVVRLRSVWGTVQPVLSTRSLEDEIILDPGDRVQVKWEVIDEGVCDTPVRAYCGSAGGGVTFLGMVDKNDSIRIPVAGKFVMRAFCYAKDDILDYYTLITPKIDLSKTTVWVH